MYSMYVWYVRHVCMVCMYGMYVLHVLHVCIACMYGMYGVKKCKLLHVADPPGFEFLKKKTTYKTKHVTFFIACCPILIPDSEYT